jgi:hypothetical protein
MARALRSSDTFTWRPSPVRLRSNRPRTPRRPAWRPRRNPPRIRRRWRDLPASLLDADPRHGLQDLVVAGPVLERAPVAIARERAVDQARIDRLHALVVDAEPGGHRGPEIVHEHVCALRPSAARPRARRGASGRDDPALAAIDAEEGPALPGEGRRVVAQIVTSGGSTLMTDAPRSPSKVQP